MRWWWRPTRSAGLASWTRCEAATGARVQVATRVWRCLFTFRVRGHPCLPLRGMQAWLVTVADKLEVRLEALAPGTGFKRG